MTSYEIWKRWLNCKRAVASNIRFLQPVTSPVWDQLEKFRYSRESEVLSIRKKIWYVATCFRSSWIPRLVLGAWLALSPRRERESLRSLFPTTNCRRECVDECVSRSAQQRIAARNDIVARRMSSQTRTRVCIRRAPNRYLPKIYANTNLGGSRSMLEQRRYDVCAWARSCKSSFRSLALAHLANTRYKVVRAHVKACAHRARARARGVRNIAYCAQYRVRSSFCE